MNIKNKNIKIMSEEKVSKALLKLGVPIIVGMLITAFNSVVDAMFVGGLGTSQMAAVSVTFPITQLITSVGLIFGCGAAPYISRLLGEKNFNKANKTASIALFNSLFWGVITIILTLVFLDKILILFGATNTMLPYAREFSTIFILGSILNIVNVTMSNIASAEGSTKISMTAMIISAVLNIILEPIFIYTFLLGIRGAAIATVVAQSITTILYIWYVLSNKSITKISFKHISFDKVIYSQMMKVGIINFIFMLLSSTAMGLINASASHYGDYAVAAMGIVTRIITFVSYGVFGYSKGFQAMVGYNYGAKNYRRFKETISESLKMTTGFCVMATAILIIFSKSIISIFSNDANVINIGSSALRANSIMFIFFGFQSIYTTLFVAVGKMKEAAILSITRQGIFFIPTIFILPIIIGLNGIIFTQGIADLLTLILTVTLVNKLKKDSTIFIGKIDDTNEEKTSLKLDGNIKINNVYVK
ncbi:MATE family efflux transporter [Clostridium weizhouense]|uniref:Multidrug export protein MepA n=1 Tax=Clostridium weizhouense TaxID=2859781 RepID=A0ABS7AQM8_9CLOT|nr:MATE family efflux transporter [Clostridium weizhouense]MBW6410854.1 MATE family efflux transporter [Clostridium weizhouense]